MSTSDRKNRPLSNTEKACREEQRRMELLSRDDIQTQYRHPTRRWLELAALSGDGPPMVKLSARMVRYQRGEFEDWLLSRKVRSTFEPVAA